MVDMHPHKIAGGRLRTSAAPRRIEPSRPIRGLGCLLRLRLRNTRRNRIAPLRLYREDLAIAVREKRLLAGHVIEIVHDVVEVPCHRVGGQSLLVVGVRCQLGGDWSSDWSEFEQKSSHSRTGET